MVIANLRASITTAGRVARLRGGTNMLWTIFVIL
ncbi:MAG: hypothetical protein QOJ88_714, partial [Pyrinomonadaceae bacterium]|nr:hypothetical protein [Pyrinomonadaceae bacterium]